MPFRKTIHAACLLLVLILLLAGLPVPHRAEAAPKGAPDLSGTWIDSEYLLCQMQFTPNSSGGYDILMTGWWNGLSGLTASFSVPRDPDPEGYWNYHHAVWNSASEGYSYRMTSGNLYWDDGMLFWYDFTEELSGYCLLRPIADRGFFGGSWEDEWSGRAWMSATSDWDDPDTSSPVSFTIRWGSSAWETEEWTFSGRYNPDTGEVPYRDCVRAIVYTDDSGRETHRETRYRNGTGKLVFRGPYLYWQDNQDHAGDSCRFTRPSWSF